MGQEGETWRYANYFARKQTRTEVQVQIRFKKDAPKDLWCYMSPKPLERVTLNMFTTTLCKLVLSATNKMLGGSLQYSFGNDGKHPHMAVPASKLLYVRATPCGEQVPLLGTADMDALQDVAKWAEN